MFSCLVMLEHLTSGYLALIQITLLFSKHGCNYNVIYGLLMSHLDQKKIILKQVKKWSPQIEGFEANLARDSMHHYIIHLMDGQLSRREP